MRVAEAQGILLALGHHDGDIPDLQEHRAQFIIRCCRRCSIRGAGCAFGLDDVGSLELALLCSRLDGAVKLADVQRDLVEEFNVILAN